MLSNGCIETHRNVMEQLLPLDWAKPYILLCSISVTFFMVSCLITKPPFCVTTGALKGLGLGLSGLRSGEVCRARAVSWWAL